MWQLKSWKGISTSPLASETVELLEAVNAGFLVVAMILEVYNLSHVPVVECLMDNFCLTEFLRTSHVSEWMLLESLNSLSHMKITGSVTKSLQQDCDPCYLHLSIFYIYICIYIYIYIYIYTNKTILVWGLVSVWLKKATQCL